MARTELVVKKQKSKGKKRKHEAQHAAADSDDEIANKSLIVDPQAPEQAPEADKVKTSKRKLHADKSKAIKEKRSKRATAVKAADSGSEDDNDEAPEPTATELKEAAKPENACAVVTVRQKKKQKHKERLVAQKDQTADKEFKRNEEYLNKWKNARKDWKFEKLRQISIQQTVFDEQKLSMIVWPVALEYLASSSGAAKANLTKLAENVIDKLDKECEQLTLESERQAIFDSASYQRARDLLQSFD